MQVGLGEVFLPDLSRSRRGRQLGVGCTCNVRKWIVVQSPCNSRPMEGSMSGQGSGTWDLQPIRRKQAPTSVQYSRLARYKVL
jgi:hypothetical protein